MAGHPMEVSPLVLSIYAGALFLVLLAYLIIRLCLERHLPTLPRFRQETETSQYGLESSNSALETIPAYRYCKKVLPVAGGESSCAVCLCEFKDGEEVRDLPHCRHSFHVPCIDKWLHSRSTCPICRTTSLVQISRLSLEPEGDTRQERDVSETP
ncbi:RING-H2 finger protein ATL79-like [Aristolochia californica]|uniref:RING-H2 finger protein ATL79-like n=1 Tax=Aristolochia californica TaxID=171875 RepID=UPI0035DE5A20